MPDTPPAEDEPPQAGPEREQGDDPLPQQAAARLNNDEPQEPDQSVGLPNVTMEGPKPETVPGETGDAMHTLVIGSNVGNPTPDQNPSMPTPASLRAGEGPLEGYKTREWCVDGLAWEEFCNTEK